MKFFRYGHIDKIKVKVGDQVKVGQLIAQNGTGNGQWYAHCHFDILTYKPIKWTEYVIGKTKDWVQERYADPRWLEKIVLPTFDHLGYGWLNNAQYSSGHAFHPGLDLNGKGSGNADLDDPIYSACEGEVVYVHSGADSNYGWGDMVVVEEKKTDEMRGIDISHYQGEIDWKKVKTDFVIQKCTQGINYVDPTYLINKKNWGGIFGSYHFADGGDPIAEADWYCQNAERDKFMVLDWEIENENPVVWCQKFIARVKENVGVDCWLYTNDARAVKYVWPEEWNFWVARYKDYSGELDFNYQPKFKNWLIWQYTSRGKIDGIYGNVDMNVSKVNLSEYNIIINENSMKLLDIVAKFLGSDYGDNVNDNELKNIEEKLGKIKENVDIQAKKIENQSEQINALTAKLAEKEMLLQEVQAAADNNFEAVSVIRLFQEAFKKLINFK